MHLEYIKLLSEGVFGRSLKQEFVIFANLNGAFVLH